MKTQKDKLDKLFQSKLENLKIPAPEGTWEDIEVKLDKKKRKKVFFLWRSAAAAVILLLISMAFYWSYSDFPVEHLEVVENYNEKQSDAIEKKTDLKKTKQKEKGFFKPFSPSKRTILLFHKLHGLHFSIAAIERQNINSTF